MRRARCRKSGGLGKFGFQGLVFAGFGLQVQESLEACFEMQQVGFQNMYVLGGLWYTDNTNFSK